MQCWLVVVFLGFWICVLHRLVASLLVWVGLLNVVWFGGVNYGF